MTRKGASWMSLVWLERFEKAFGPGEENGCENNSKKRKTRNIWRMQLQSDIQFDSNKCLCNGTNAQNVAWTLDVEHLQDGQEPSCLGIRIHQDLGAKYASPSQIQHVGKFWILGARVCLRLSANPLKERRSTLGHFDATMQRA
jgi:hypothetical protein